MCIARASVAGPTFAEPGQPATFSMPEGSDSSSARLVDLLDLGETTRALEAIRRGAYHRCKAFASFPVKLCRRCS